MKVPASIVVAVKATCKAERLAKIGTVLIALSLAQASEAAAIAAAVSAAREARAAALDTKAATRAMRVAATRRPAVVKTHGWNAEIAAAQAAARENALVEEVNKKMAARENAAILAAAIAAGKAKTERNLALLAEAKARVAKEVSYTSKVVKEERKALLAPIAAYKTAIKWANKKGRNARLLARLVLVENKGLAAARAEVAKVAPVKRARK